VQKCTFSFFYLLIYKGLQRIKCQSREKVSENNLIKWEKIPIFKLRNYTKVITLVGVGV